MPHKGEYFKGNKETTMNESYPYHINRKDLTIYNYGTQDASAFDRATARSCQQVVDMLEIGEYVPQVKELARILGLIVRGEVRSSVNDLGFLNAWINILYDSMKRLASTANPESVGEKFVFVGNLCRRQFSDAYHVDGNGSDEEDVDSSDEGDVDSDG